MKTNLDYLNLLRLDTGPRLMALMRMRDPARALAGASDLLAAIEEAIEQDEPLFEREILFRSMRDKKARHGRSAPELDQRLDRLLATIAAGLEVQIRLVETAPQRAALAAAMRAALFPEGLTGLIRKPYVDQAQGTRILLRRYRQSPDFQSLAEAIGLAEAFEKIAELNAAYSAALSAAIKPPNSKELKAARDAGHRRLGAIVSRVLGRFPTESEKDRRARHALLDPIERQIERRRADYRARKRRGPAVEEAA